MKSIFKPQLILILVIILFSCEKENPNQLQSNSKVFNLELFEQNIIDYVTDNGNTPVAWAYTISINGQLQKSKAYGQARIATDGALDFTINKEINTASVTKFYTAIAAMQLLESNNLTIDDKIAGWLPDDWTLGQGVDQLSFKDLLKHESGLESTNSDFDNTLSYEGLKNCIETGVINSPNRNYLNVNFALFRVLIPSLWNATTNEFNYNIKTDLGTQLGYISYMQRNIFSKTGLSNVDCEPESRAIATFYYNNNDAINNTSGSYYGTWTHKSAGGGYFMSIMEMARINAYFEHSEILVTETQRDIMKEHRLGMDSRDQGNEEHGQYYGKNGSIGNSSDSNVSQGVLTQIQMFPSNGVDCVVVMNSQGNTFFNNLSLRQLIFRAYNDAWE